MNETVSNSSSGTCVTISAWLPAALAQQITALARKNDRSISGEISVGAQASPGGARF